MKRPNRAPTLPSLSGSGPTPTINPTTDGWKVVAGDYCTLTDADCDLLSKWLNSYLIFAVDEENTVPLADALSVLKKIRKPALELIAAMQCESHDGKFEAYNWAMNELARFCTNEGDDRAITIGNAVENIATGCDTIISNYERNPPDGFRRGDAWNALAYKIMKWASDQNLPVTISSPTGAYDNWPSPFVKFFRRMIDLLPAEHRRFATDQAVTVLISTEN